MSEILYVKDMARKLGKTEASIRAAINRGADWIPAPFPMGRRLAWRLVDVDAFLVEQSKRTGR
jgi:predicted DNA-binding transcriptional regulator AlpA